ncbi:HD domain-containing protein [Gemmata sp. G18]|uniref:HD domain-containing protein n=1 Tax=Gemmata palustris TaxID=2822762 RepID=A0ABS5C0P3_9BACT|nr:HD domain-containing protein [Gemmata palustris]MBP3959524.1 HD domain-containing protein [Gemmata palustris]
MNKRLHELRDPIHTFIRLDTDERQVLDSRPVQRLRYIHQLALTYLIYPGATHKRFEHSLGVMELAGRVYDIVTNPANLVSEAARDLVPTFGSFDHQRWRRVVRMAALCHDIGHLPFSHAGEELLPDKKKHEHLTIALVESKLMRPLWDALNIKPADVARLGVGPGKYPSPAFSDWEAILSEIITGDAFGADRIDYLLRDGYHAGVAYGQFDHNRLIDNLRILPKTADRDAELTLGIDSGGLHATEALLLARYFMYTQVYFHPVRRVYDHHLVSFFKAGLPNGQFSLDLEQHLQMTDNELTAELFAAARTPAHAGCVPARLIAEREHFRLVYQRNPEDLAKNVNAAAVFAEELASRFSSTSVHYARYRERNRAIDFPVWTRGGVCSALALSEILNRLPVAGFDYIFVAQDKKLEAERWLRDNRERMLSPEVGTET